LSPSCCYEHVFDECVDLRENTKRSFRKSGFLAKSSKKNFIFFSDIMLPSTELFELRLIGKPVHPQETSRDQFDH